MSFIEHTIAWCQGEILEGKIIVIYALTLMILSIFILPMTHLSNSKFLIIPLLLSALIFLMVGGSLIFRKSYRVYKKWKETYRWIYALVSENSMGINHHFCSCTVHMDICWERIDSLSLLCHSIVLLFWIGHRLFFKSTRSGLFGPYTQRNWELGQEPILGTGEIKGFKLIHLA